MDKKEYLRQYRLAHKKELQEKAKLYREKHREEMIAYGREYRENNKEALAEKRKIKYENNKEAMQKVTRTNWNKHKDKYNERRRTDKAFIERRREQDRIRYKKHRNMYDTSMYSLPEVVNTLDTKHVEYKGIIFGIATKGYLKHEGLDLHVALAKDYLNWFEGCEVHHKDGNVFNNTLDNLVCLMKEEHIEAHRQLRASKKKEV